MTQPMTVIFDMDGVILDTEHLVLHCWKQLAPAYARTVQEVEEIFPPTIGTTRKYTGEIVRAHWGEAFPYEQFDADVSRTFHRIADAEGIPLKPGARELLADLFAHGCRIGLASSTRQTTLESELRRAGLDTYFDFMLGGDRIAHSKPAPDIYLAACRGIGVRPQDAFAVEDSYNGIRAAHGAGMMPIMVPDMLQPTPEIAALCHAVFPGLPQLQAYLRDLRRAQP